jgi:hypothetical protein
MPSLTKEKRMNTIVNIAIAIAITVMILYGYIVYSLYG